MISVPMTAVAAVTLSMSGGDWRSEAATSVERGLAFLVSTQQADGGWKHRDASDPAVTALVAKCFIEHPKYGPDHEVSRRAISYIRRFVQPDGGIYIVDKGLANYYTSVALMAFSTSPDASLKPVIRDAQTFLKKKQWDEAESIDPKHEWYGGAGYGKHKRPDLSNTQMMLEALHQSGLAKDDPVYKKALVFISRCQNSAETNNSAFARGGVNDGGFVYTAANGGESKAGERTEGDVKRLRSYGSMTYAGFKSLLYAGVSKDDPRVRAAFEWISKHYTLTTNPNMPHAQSKQGLYYYYHVFARALEAWGDKQIVDADGKSHDWRRELCEVLVAAQRSDGSWINEEDRWYEGNAHLVTAYAIQAIQTTNR